MLIQVSSARALMVSSIMGLEVNVKGNMNTWLRLSPPCCGSVWPEGGRTLVLSCLNVYWTFCTGGPSNLHNTEYIMVYIPYRVSNGLVEAVL